METFITYDNHLSMEAKYDPTWLENLVFDCKSYQQGKNYTKETTLVQNTVSNNLLGGKNILIVELLKNFQNNLNENSKWLEFLKIASAFLVRRRWIWWALINLRQTLHLLTGESDISAIPNKNFDWLRWKLE